MLVPPLSARSLVASVNGYSMQVRAKNRAPRRCKGSAKCEFRRLLVRAKDRMARFRWGQIAAKGISMKGIYAAMVAALATFSAMAASAQGGKVIVGPAGYAQGPNTLLIAGAAPVPTVGPGDHVVICHALGEANKNTYVQIAPSAGVVFGHAGAGHQIGEDIIPPFIYQPNGKKGADSSLAGGQNWGGAAATVYSNGCGAPPASTDVCPNIAGDQATVPAGMVKDAHGNCVPATPPPDHPSTDVCPNIAGDQATVPAGMVKDAHGNCVASSAAEADHHGDAAAKVKAEEKVKAEAKAKTKTK
jgi:hypothetical protein